MSSGEVLPSEGAYATGRIASTSACVLHPGGIELTLRAVSLAGLRRKARVLDLGCGTGATVLFLRSHEFEAIGIDSAYRPTSEILDLYCQRACAEKLPFEFSSLDAVLAECSLSLMNDPARVLSECARVVRPGGSIIICDLYARNPADISAVRALDQECVCGLLIREELERWLQHSGFAITCFEDHSKELCEAMARFILDHDSPAEL
ncbi:MAG TPA: methyltransferase domain-containing protein, partial [Terriglobales bacterium]